MELDNRQSRIIQNIDDAASEIIEASHQIHDHPELGYQEVFASNLLVEKLQKHGFQVEKGFVGIDTAFCARKGSGKGPRVAFLAEYDALPGIGHGCGHNVIGTSAMAAGIGLGAVVEETGGDVWVIGTPAEETDGAKVTMVERGAFNNVDAALMIHPHEGNYYVTESLAMDCIEIAFTGKPAHAASAPWEGKNALDAMILTFTNINALRQQIQPDARIHGVILDGGKAPNIIPDYTMAHFYVRAKKRSYLNELVEKFKACAQAGAHATGTEMSLRYYENSFDDMLSNLTISERMRDYMSEILGMSPILRAPENFGSVDMGNVSHVTPAIHVLVDIAQGKPLIPHTVEFQVAAATPYADGTLIKSGKALALTGYDLLTQPEFLEKAREEFTKEMGKPPARS
ncbi:MAG: M20 family metallopeptidase [Anaerolineales bacterium]|nr:M20 family metallopeptidase [Anaerolineales bacterium]